MSILRATGRIGSQPLDDRFDAFADAVTRLARALTRTVWLAWALTMTVAGGLMMLGASEAASWLASTLWCAGLTGIVSGVFVFQVLVADRLFPDADSGLVRNVETVLGVALIIGVVLTALTLLT